MNTIQATLAGHKTLVHMLLGHTPEIPNNTSLNQRLGILDTAKPTSAEKVYLGYLVVGNKGHRNVTGDGGVGLTSVLDHTATHTAPYGPIPFVLRRITDDLPKAQRDLYVLRKLITFSGVQYYAYYGMRMNISPADVTVATKKVTIVDSKEKEEVYTFTTSDLYPEPVTLPVSGAISTSPVSVKVTCPIRVSFGEFAIAEFVNALKILNNGDERYAVMSEFSLCTGADRVIQVPVNTGTSNFTEVVGCQVYNYAMDHKALYYNSQELNLDFDLGSSLPLLAAQSIATLTTIP